MATKQATPPRDRSGPIRRLAAIDLTLAEAIFEAATTLLVPDDLSQRKAFEDLMPLMYVLRNKGCSYAQLTKLLTDAGFVLQPSTVRSYYSEMLATRQDICQARMNEQILLLAAMRKETKGANISDIEGRVAAITDQQKNQVAAKLNAVFGAVPAAAVLAIPVVVPVAPVVQAASSPPPKAAVPVAGTPRAENKKSGLRPVPVDPAPGGALDVATSGGKGVDDSLSPILLLGAWKCSTLPSGVKSLERRAGLPDEVYLPGDLFHPAAPGVSLSLDQRLSSVALEFVSLGDGEIRLESADQKRFRVLWKTPLVTAETRTSGSFVKMNDSLFKAT